MNGIRNERQRGKNIHIRLILLFIVWGICFVLGMKIAMPDLGINGLKLFSNTLPKTSYANENLPLSGKTIVVDAGHGGSDSGTLGVMTGVREDVLSLEIATLLELKLKKMGASVVMTRTKEITEALRNERKLSFEERGAIIEGSNADMMLSIHQNFNEDSSQIKGVQILLRDKEYLDIATQFQNTFNNALGTRLNIIKDQYAVLSFGNQPSFIIECGFLSNSEDESNLQTKEYQEKLVDILCDEIQRQLNSSFN
ncbi:MAG: N-acetylmuramoyl-L-alanine amidase [Anaerovorax sp.]|nr:N-acetylmuramoyl-L-alanine amidase [Anaerovorax sp.]